jgi:hypothetical protein
MHGCIGYFINPKKRNVAELGEHQSIQGKVSLEPQETISKAKRFCRFGAGHKETVGNGDTPGFECNSKTTITLEGHGFTKNKVFKSPRNTRRIIQTSIFLTQVWRGNEEMRMANRYSINKIPATKILKISLHAVTIWRDTK